MCLCVPFECSIAVDIGIYVSVEYIMALEILMCGSEVWAWECVFIEYQIGVVL